MNEKVKLVAAGLAVIAGFVAFYALSDKLFAIRLGVLLAGFAAGATIAWFTETGKRFLVFVREAWVETQKVVWPTRKETIQTTGIVFLLVVVMAVFLAGVDWVLFKIAKLFMGQPD